MSKYVPLYWSQLIFDSKVISAILWGWLFVMMY